ncbi:hypothetical protein HYH03_011324 [Edaphochlamys debaryana]|uniref:Uncharacterized protein n=1 Tax=Edaphochlamys debaryana TaxID=47281 RepID=A0A836BVM7_9CHLO|nr:hypothetical protein HYH03_011324 [Edaphochlamys debaryana]|eukprot:KAG2490197.1 hypothetical protein HYH03_011324 [Edaphochlamys debaryana]
MQSAASSSRSVTKQEKGSSNHGSNAGGARSNDSTPRSQNGKSLAQRIARRDDFDVDSEDDDLDGFIYEDESTSEDEREDYVNAFCRKKKVKADDYSEYEGAAVRALTAGRKAPKSAAMRRQDREASDSEESSDDGDDEYDPEEERIRELRMRKRAEQKAKAQALASAKSAASAVSAAGTSVTAGGKPGAANVGTAAAYAASAASQYWQTKRDEDDVGTGDDEPQLSRLQQLKVLQERAAAKAAAQAAAAAKAAQKAALKSAKREKVRVKIVASDEDDEDGGGGGGGTGGGGGGVSSGGGGAKSGASGTGAGLAGGAGAGGGKAKGGVRIAEKRSERTDRDSGEELEETHSHTRFAEPGGGQRDITTDNSTARKWEDEQRSVTHSVTTAPFKPGGGPGGPGPGPGHGPGSVSHPTPPSQPPPANIPLRLPQRKESEGGGIVHLQPPPGPQSDRPGGGGRERISLTMSEEPPMSERISLGAGRSVVAKERVSVPGESPLHPTPPPAHAAAAGRSKRTLVLPSSDGGAGPSAAKAPPAKVAAAAAGSSTGPAHAPHAGFHPAAPHKSETTKTDDFDVDEMLNSFQPPGAGKEATWAGARPQPPSEPRPGADISSRGAPEQKRSIRNVKSDFVSLTKDDDDPLDVAARMLSLPATAARPVQSVPTGTGSGGLSASGLPVSGTLSAPASGAVSAPSMTRFSRVGSSILGPSGPSVSHDGSPLAHDASRNVSITGGSPRIGSVTGASPMRPKRQSAANDATLMAVNSAPQVGIGGGGGGLLPPAEASPLRQRPSGLGSVGSGALGSPRQSLNGTELLLPSIRPPSQSGSRASESGSPYHSGGLLGGFSQDLQSRSSNGGASSNGSGGGAGPGSGQIPGMSGGSIHGRSRFGNATHQALQAEAMRASMPSVPAREYDSDSALSREPKHGHRASWNGTSLQPTARGPQLPATNLGYGSVGGAASVGMGPGPGRPSRLGQVSMVGA